MPAEFVAVLAVGEYPPPWEAFGRVRRVMPAEFVAVLAVGEYPPPWEAFGGEDGLELMRRLWPSFSPTGGLIVVSHGVLRI